MRVTHILSSLALLVALPGCFDRDLGGKPCDASHPCLDGFICGAGSCLPPGEACVGDADCTAPETCVAGLCENVDPDCVDGDGDRRGEACDAGADCNDADPAIFATVSAFPDADLDGAGAGAAVELCTDGTIPAGHAATDTDCNDADAAGQVTVSAFVDGDGDGAGAGQPVTLCTDGTIPAGHSANNTDCDDASAAPGQALISAFVDADRDGVGAGAPVSLCVTNGVIPAGHSATSTDCDDADAAVSVPLSGFVDVDGDGIGAGAATTLCTGGALGAGQSATGGDNCADVANRDQADDEGDGVGDACDLCPVDDDAGQQNALETNAGQAADGVGDLCDPRPALGGDTIALFNTLDSLSGWQQVSGTWVQSGNGFRQNSNNGAGFLRRQNLDVGNQVVEAALSFGFNTDDIVGVAARLDGNGDGYACAMNRANDTLEVRLVDNGALAGTLASTAHTAPGLNQAFRLRFSLDGSALGCTFVGGPTVSDTDTTHSTGTVGIATSATRATVDKVVVYRLGT